MDSFPLLEVQKVAKDIWNFPSANSSLTFINSLEILYCKLILLGLYLREKFKKKKKKKGFKGFVRIM